MLTETVQKIRIPRSQALGVLDGGQGPVTSSGTLRNGYFFPLDSGHALQLLRMAGMQTTDAVSENEEHAERLDGYSGSVSDRLTIASVRAEQRFLRGQQLLYRGNTCSLCGLSLPDELFVAAHIKPRWACSENERMDARNVAMLACLLGCDALFELGYVVVSEQGIIEPGKRRSEQVADRIQHVVDRKCLAHGEESRQYFAWHRDYLYSTADRQ
ncbi:HNH endonuclease [Arthrobacter sp. AFG20]|uniref:HNH endonuclease n=1 Tax=Arthrobacter sp. AFG20 TaxID=1688671 RepID=UPI000C9EB35A|nr:HNH endonuclease [Arthrobacter sp. AFG20]PNH86113.1 hypothetical protein CXZ05_03150 [Arthrobacter sp. AFG20]